MFLIFAILSTILFRRRASRLVPTASAIWRMYFLKSFGRVELIVNGSACYQ